MCVGEAFRVRRLGERKEGERFEHSNELHIRHVLENENVMMERLFYGPCNIGPSSCQTVNGNLHLKIKRAEKRRKGKRERDRGERETGRIK